MIPLSGDLAKAKGIKSENVDSIGVTKGTSTLKRGFAHMLKNGVVMDVTTVEQAQIAEEAGVLDPDSDTKKKSAKSPKPSKLEAETKSDVKDAPESDSSVDVDSKTDNIPEDSE